MTQPRYVFACPRGHKVAVDSGRYWTAARCPTCKSPVDRFRLARLRQWIRGAAPRSRLRIGKVVLTPFDGLAWLLVLFLLVVLVIYRTMGDRTWWGTVLIYSGRWPWILPVLLLLPFALAWRRTALVPLGVGALLVAGPIMGGHVSLAGLRSGEGALRVLTYNVENGDRVAFRLGELLAEEKPDIAGFQECGPFMHQALGILKGWAAVDTSSVGICFLSRYPIRGAPQRMEAHDFRMAGGSAAIARYELITPGGIVHVFVLHLETPRHGVEHLLRDPANAPRYIESNNILRDTESRVVRRWIDSVPGPRIVMGDFNLPVESIIWQQYWNGALSDAFGEAGNGWGFTKLNGWIRVRIDHVLHTEQLRVVGTHVGTDWGSDHLPFVAEVKWK